MHDRSHAYNNNRNIASSAHQRAVVLFDHVMARSEFYAKPEVTKKVALFVSQRVPTTYHINAQVRRIVLVI
jgi:hypothetical protein